NVQNVVLKTGAGDDSIVVTNAGNTLDFIPDVTVNAGGGTNTLTADDSGYSGGDTYQVTENQVLLPYSLGLIATFSNIQNVNIKTGAGDDTIIVTNSGNTLDFLPDVFIDGGGGFNQLLADDSAYGGGDTYQISENQLFLPYTLGLIATFSNVQNV